MKAERLLVSSERGLWIAAILLYGVGDTATTFLGLTFAPVAEVGPVAGPLMDAYGQAALLVIKGVTFSLFYTGWRLLPSPTRVAIPLAVAAVGAAVTGWNLVMILSVVS